FHVHTLLPENKTENNRRQDNVEDDHLTIPPYWQWRPRLQPRHSDPTFPFSRLAAESPTPRSKLYPS
uniref:Uncharacterized protein n=1 Tax=Aegilops tauschii subsp. strangulata TaxID=200361 RepID=A0A453E8Z4_AEGTS